MWPIQPRSWSSSPWSAATITTVFSHRPSASIARRSAPITWSANATFPSYSRTRCSRSASLNARRPWFTSRKNGSERLISFGIGPSGPNIVSKGGSGSYGKCGSRKWT